MLYHLFDARFILDDYNSFGCLLLNSSPFLHPLLIQDQVVLVAAAGGLRPRRNFYLPGRVIYRRCLLMLCNRHIIDINHLFIFLGGCHYIA